MTPEQIDAVLAAITLQAVKSEPSLFDWLQFAVGAVGTLGTLALTLILVCNDRARSRREVISSEREAEARAEILRERAYSQAKEQFRVSNHLGTNDAQFAVSLGKQHPHNLWAILRAYEDVTQGLAFQDSLSLLETVRHLDPKGGWPTVETWASRDRV